VRRFDRSFLAAKPLTVKFDVEHVTNAVAAAFADMNKGLALMIDRQREENRRRAMGDEVYESLYGKNMGKRWDEVYADQLIGYPVRIDLTIGDGPDVFPCPTPRPAGAPDAEQRTGVDAQQP
jgi:hypothetical protein